MSNIVRAWKNEAYRQSLSAEERAMLPENPAGGFELTDAELETVYGAWGKEEGKHSQDFCSNAQVCRISASAGDDTDDSCVSVGIGNDCDN